MGMLKTIAQAWKVAEIRSKMIFTLLMLVVFRIGSNIPVPNINRSVLQEMFSGETGLFDLFDLFSGGSFSNFTIFALSITPYITASIIVQLLTIAFPYFERLAKEGMEGRKKMAQITRYMTVVLALVQAIGLTVGLFRKAVVDRSAFSVIVVVLVLTAGTAFLMWLGELINDKGIGNGISRRYRCKNSKRNQKHFNCLRRRRNLSGNHYHFHHSCSICNCRRCSHSGRTEKNSCAVCKESCRKKDVRRTVNSYSY